MRERLTAAFVALSVTLLVALLLVRSYTVESDLRAHESDHVLAQAQTMAGFLAMRLDAELPVTESVLAGVVGPDQRLEYDAVGERPLVAEGDGFDEGNDGQDFAAVAAVEGHDASLTLLQSDEAVDDLVGDERGSIALLALLVAIVAAMVGYLIAKLLAAPFLKLAVAAQQLGRGRFDLELPHTRVPEARAIGQALQTSAGQLQERLASEEAFAQHASHVLRTPLTGLRLDLDDLSTRTDLPQDVRATMAHAVVRIDAMDEIAGELVALSRSNSLIAGADVALRDLGTQCAQYWADSLGHYDRPLTAAVDGVIDTRYTPGPIEFVLDILLTDVLRRSRGAVRLTFHADDEGHLTINVTSTGETRTGPGDDRALAKARAVVTALGGRLKGTHPGDEGLTVWLPRR
ncbi:HAMP domain-containing protein [Nocardioides sp.]|uniref:sensor histidine kinase n=1 Tax=Nocardioides sp. TaxID=35761 RepID=UPI001A259F7A|nr:HAMP domain-containing protein [Nocardioides sp.]MBJ7355926.1 HAMP domain-containing histidine kinase [Nocardioides sp.]